MPRLPATATAVCFAALGAAQKDRGGRSEVAFNLGGTWKLHAHFNLLFAAGRDIIGDTTLATYLGVQYLTK